jgi:hypothetical protein
MEFSYKFLEPFCSISCMWNCEIKLFVQSSQNMNYFLDFHKIESQKHDNNN